MIRRARFVVATLLALLVWGAAAAAGGPPGQQPDGRPSVHPTREAPRIVPTAPIEVTARGSRRTKLQAAVRTIFASDDLPDGMTPRPRRELPRRAFGQEGR